MSPSSLRLTVTGRTAGSTKWAGPALFSDGFRPFYLLAGAAAVLMIPFWMLVFFGILPARAYFPPVLWHVHEMLFGYTAAVMVGYLFTALPNWTGRSVPQGPTLAGLAALWLLGRVAILVGGEWAPLLVAVIDVSFLPLAVLCILPPLLRARNLHNIAVPASLLGLAGPNGAMHLEPAGIAALGEVAGRGALALITAILVIISGRVVPSVTASTLPDVGAGRLHHLDTLALTAVVASLVISVFRPGTTASGILALVAGALLIGRSIFWKPWATRSLPMLWALHLGHVWIALSFLMRGVYDFGVPMQPSLPDHALTVGAIGGMTLAMMSRSALGHTGRKIAAGPWLTTSFVCINVAAWARCLAPLMIPSHVEQATIVATVFWTLAFAIFLGVFAPKLISARADTSAFTRGDGTLPQRV